MPRYNRIRGPAAPFELIASFVPIPGFTLTRFFDDGELLILARVHLFNGTAGAGDISIRFTLDGSNFQPQVPSMTLPAGARGTLSDVAFQAISEGTHTITLDAFGLAAAGDTVVLGGAELVIIQLPLWETVPTLISL